MGRLTPPCPPASRGETAWHPRKRDFQIPAGNRFAKSPLGECKTPREQGETEGHP